VLLALRSSKTIHNFEKQQLLHAFGFIRTPKAPPKADIFFTTSMHQTTDIILVNWSVMTFIPASNRRKSKKTRGNIKPFKFVLPTIHEDVELLLPAFVISSTARAASRKNAARVHSSYRMRVPKSDLLSFFKRHRITAEQTKNKKQCSSSKTIWV
jgi:hypothetical protein